MNDQNLHYSRGRNIHDNQPAQRHAADFGALVAALDRDRAPAKAGAGYIAGPLGGDRRRAAENALARRWLAVDLDRIAEAVLPELRLHWTRFSACAWPTHSNRPEAPRERVLIELDRAASRAECIEVGRVLAHDLAEEFGNHVLVDASTFRGEQPVFLPPAGVRLARFDGAPLVVDNYLQAAQELPTPAPDRPPGGDRAVGGTAVAAGRNEALSREAYRLRKQGRSVAQIDAVLQAMNHAICTPPLGEDEVRGIAGRKSRVQPDPQDARTVRPVGPTDTLPLVARNIDAAGELGADFADPVAAAREIVGTLYTEDGLRVLHYWQGEFHFWMRSHYVVLPMADMREMLYSVGPVVSAKPVKKRTVDDVMDALKAAANLSHRKVPAAPAWVGRQAGDPDPRAVIPVRNGLVYVDTGELSPATPRLFVPYALPFDYAPDAATPAEWLRFLASIWAEDQESVDALQEWLGYLLTADTAQQKVLMIVGPRRSGKGTIGRVIVQLLGERNVASPTLAALGTNFGLEPLIGKTAALMSDARLGSRADIAAVAENLLRLTGEDAISVDRKFREAYTAKLLARVVVLTNEVPVFRDAASALPSRFIILRTDRSFYGQEDHGLDRKLAAELPGILVWALAGLRRLRERGRFIQPAAGIAHMRLMEDLASPIGAFARDACILEPGVQVPVSKLYEAWREWCKEHGRDQPGTEQTFGRDVSAAVPGVGHIRPRINGVRVRMYTGIRLRTPDDPFEDEDDAQDL